MIREANVAGNAIAKLGENVDPCLRPRAKRTGRAAEGEARTNLHEAVDGESKPKNLAQIIEDCVASLGGVELELPPR